MIRQANINDLDSIYHLCDSEPFKWSEDEPPYDKEWLTDLINNENGITLVYESDNIIKGVICSESLISNGTMLWFLAVDKDYRNKIIGPKLYLEFENKCKEKDITWIYTLAYKTTENMLPIAGYKTNNRTYKEFYKEL